VRAASPLVLEAAAASIRGLRADNQDAGCAGAQLLAVADGVGGKPGGATAAALVIRRLVGSVAADVDAPDGGLAAAVAAANADLAAVATAHPELAGMATTLTAAVLAPQGHLVVAHVGDTRAYLFRRGQLRLLTTDHTFVQGLVDAGVIDSDQARRHPFRSVVVRTLQGREADAQVDVTVHPMRSGDRVLLCSDGLSGAVDPDLISRILSEERRPADATDRLLRAALAAGTHDNVTAVVADLVHAGAAPTAVPAAVGADWQEPVRPAAVAENVAA
jgi:protein phosphatase